MNNKKDCLMLQHQTVRIIVGPNKGLAPEKEGIT